MNGDFEIATVKLNRDEFDSLSNYESSPIELLEKSTMISKAIILCFLKQILDQR